MNLTSHLSVNTFYRVINILISYLTVVVASGLMGVGGYGLLALMITNAVFFNLISAFGTDTGVAFYASNGSFEFKKIISVIFSVVAIQVVLLGITEIICYLLTGYCWIFKTSNIQYCWIGLLFMISVSITEKYTALFNGHYLFALCSKIILVTNFLLLLSFSLFYFFSPGHTAFFFTAIYSASFFFQSIFLVVVFHQRTRKPLRLQAVNTAELKTFFSFSLITMVTNTVQFFAYRADYWFVDYYKGEQELGLYSIAVKLVQAFWFLPVLFAGILFPYIAKEKIKYNCEKMLLFLRLLFLINIVAGIVSFWVVQWGIPAIFGATYIKSIFPFKVMLPGVILFCYAPVLAAYFAGTNLLKINLVSSVIGLICIISLNFLLIPLYGMNGAAIASSAGYSLSAIYLIVVFCRKSNTGVKKLFLPGAADWQFLYRFLMFK